MRTFFSKSGETAPKLSLVLLDWSCRESFHILDYLAKQTVPRHEYEILWLEYYDRKAQPIEARLGRSGALPALDVWAALEIPRDTYFHKHLMYNAGIVMSRGEIVVICDSDAMVKETFVESILKEFEGAPRIVLHLDQFRNERRDLYPFNYPSFETILGEGCINNADGRTAGLMDRDDPLHARNYGACMAARRADLIAIGGADEHSDYLGHICGPYDMTFRLINFGCKEVWHSSEFLYHAWHPGAGGEKNYLGPHDGKNMSTTALSARSSGRIEPLCENPAIRRLRSSGAPADPAALQAELIDRERLDGWCETEVKKLKKRSLSPAKSGGAVSATLVKMVARQLWIKLTRVPRQVKTPAMAIKKAGNAMRFVRNSFRYNVYIAEQSQRIFKDLASQGNTEVSLYGTGDIAELLCKLSKESPVTIRSVYDDYGEQDFAGFRVQPVRDCASDAGKIIVAAMVGIEEKIERLQRHGVARDRIVNLQ